MDTHHPELSPRTRVNFWNSGSNWQWFILICLIYVYSSYLSQTLVVSDSLFYNSYGEQMAYDRIEQMLDLQAKWSWVSYLFIPLVIGIKLLLVSLCLLGGSIWENLRLSFRKVWSMVLRAELVFAVGAVCIVLYLAFFVELNSLEDLQGFHNFSLMALLANEEDPTAWYLYPLQVVNLFEILYWIILVKGIQAISKKGVSESIGLVGRSYGLGLLIWVFLVIFLKLNLGI